MPRPTTPLLSRTRIREHALQVVDAAGLDGLSMRKLASGLGVQAASLYSHYRTKDELLQDIADSVMSAVDVSDFAGTDWQAGLRTWARSYRAALAAHPNLVPVLAAGPARRETALQRADAVHGGLVRAGWPPRYATMIGASTKYLVLGAAMSSFSRGFEADVQVYVDRYPHLDQAHRLRDHADEIDAESFELALEAFVTGLVALRSRVG
ncbi:Transcriptional regulator, TetR family [Actinokineospora spheciospongiae]|uniref:Transcriptional regulator, TetR family n=1 Tax=Actinokineospora spheciospongiae TaxID=909613 RepID=W7IY02_9PSEU|nr:TetR/AcrR family transcriptional regulator C-terminal domain-containing protein [Actinokineospora spheciospongiae]EWC58924.1 Transcriptional regulator, TetR family [Actinokineospora spheciospongiae]PWW62682.1 TetR family transcriptional regulator [Actinokineospora spheciospongiae]